MPPGARNGPLQAHVARRPAHTFFRKGIGCMITIENIKSQSGTRHSRVLIRRNGVSIGRVEKLRNTATESHPWKAFFYITPPGPKVQTEYLGAFYTDQGGKRDAIQAIIKRATT